METKSKHIQARRHFALELKMQILSMLQWEDDVYCELQYNCGLAYLQYYIPTDPGGIDFLTRSKVYWNWWKNRWAERDQEFIKDTDAKLALHTKSKLYLELHDPLMLSQDIYPNAIIMGDSYAVMYQEVIDHPELDAK